MEKRHHRLADISAHRMTREILRGTPAGFAPVVRVRNVLSLHGHALIAPCTLFAKPQLAAPPPTKNHQFSALKSPTRFLTPRIATSRYSVSLPSNSSRRYTSNRGIVPKQHLPTMSRFFRGGDESSSDSSSDEEELYSDEEKRQRQGAEEDDSDDSDDMNDSDDSDDSSSDDGAGGANRFLRDAASDSESEEEEVRAKVKSAKDKRLDELDASIKLIENGQKNGDWTLISAGMCMMGNAGKGQ